MWSICVLALILDPKVVSSRNIVQKAKALEGYMKITVANEDEKKLSYFDKGIGNRDLRWPLGIVKYYIDHESYDYLVVERVRLAMNSIEETSCVRFKPILEPFTDGHFLHITNRNRVRECTHETAANDTSLEIIVTIGIDCLQRRDITHLLMHALGFKDEVTHPQRNQYVRILWDNINPAYRSLFRIEHEDFPSRTEYDFNSIMHFHDRAFSKNGQATIASLIPGLIIDPSRELSSLDKMKLRLMFGHECNRREVGDLLDTCKNALHIGEGKGENPEPEGNPDAKAEGEDGAKADGEDGAKADGEDGAKADGEDGAKDDGEDGTKADGEDSAKADGEDGAKADGEEGGSVDPDGHVEEGKHAEEAGDVVPEADNVPFVEEGNHVEETVADEEEYTSTTPVQTRPRTRTAQTRPRSPPVYTRPWSPPVQTPPWPQHVTTPRNDKIYHDYYTRTTKKRKNPLPRGKHGKTRVDWRPSYLLATAKAST